MTSDPAERLLLHAATLGFAHPSTGKPVRLESKLPPAFTKALARLRERPALTAPVADTRSARGAARSTRG